MVCLICKIPCRTIFCDHCRAQILRLREPSLRDQKIYKTRALFSWRQTSPKALTWMAHGLKRREELKAWLEISSWMINAFGPLSDTVFVPIPSANPRNHARGLARALSYWSGFPVAEALEVAAGHGSQKKLNREVRQDISFERVIWSFCREYTQVIIVDDVITTGATVRAAYHALGRPKSCEVWCLMDRRPCGG